MKNEKFNDSLELSGDLRDEYDAIQAMGKLAEELDDEPLTDKQIEELLQGMYEDE